MFNGLSPWHLAILALVVIILFGAKKLPDAARSIGKSMKIFKAETKDMRDGGDKGQSESGESASVEPDAKQLPASGASAEPTAEKQMADLQRQLDELKKQQAPAADTAPKNTH